MYFLANPRLDAVIWRMHEAPLSGRRDRSEPREDSAPDLLYAALAQGQMGIVSPITAVLSGAVPVLVGVIRGESLSPTAIAGILAAGLAVILVSRETGPHKKTPPRAIAIAIASGLAIGAYLSVLGSAPDDSGIWVATIGRWFSSILVVIALIIWLVRTEAGWSSAGSFPWGLAVAAGGLDALANAVFQLAAQRGLLAIVAVIGSLYPAATLLLARFLLHERIIRLQLVGVLLALAAAATLALA